MEVVVLGDNRRVPSILMYFHGGEAGRSVADQFQTALADNTRKQYKDIGDLTPDEATMVKYLSDEKWLKVGSRSLFRTALTATERKGAGMSARIFVMRITKPLNL